MSIRIRPAVHPGEVLLEEFVLPLGLTAAGLSAALQVPSSEIERLTAEQTAVTPALAIRLGRYFETTPDFWMNLQTAYDLTEAEDHVDLDALAAITPHHFAHS